MGHTIKLAAVGAVAFMTLDGLGLGLLMKNSTLREWPFVLTLADVAWGAVASASCAVAVRLVVL
jgi:uncharacterized membrane protein